MRTFLVFLFVVSTRALEPPQAVRILQNHLDQFKNAIDNRDARALFLLFRPQSGDVLLADALFKMYEGAVFTVQNAVQDVKNQRIEGDVWVYTMSMPAGTHYRAVIKGGKPMSPTRYEIQSMRLVRLGK
ncbi:unnamed protein product [Caenorhabditis sp. 36 PRJEB53466]|nr:unnamed protein product [Caenorhabditis sp. 36 PRJEB53466]